MNYSIWQTAHTLTFTLTPTLGNKIQTTLNLSRLHTHHVHVVSTRPAGGRVGRG